MSTLTTVKTTVKLKRVIFAGVFFFLYSLFVDEID